jgi:hypothetical protein
MTDYKGQDVKGLLKRTFGTGRADELDPIVTPRPGHGNNKIGTNREPSRVIDPPAKPGTPKKPSGVVDPAPGHPSKRSFPW